MPSFGRASAMSSPDFGGDMSLSIDADLPLTLHTDTGIAPNRADSLRAPDPVTPFWKDLLRTRRLSVMDTNVVYPRFVDFCLRVYRWYTLNFSTFDPEYVEGIRKHGKLRLVSDNWATNFLFRTHDGIPIAIAGDPYFNLGFNINYYAVSYGYSWDMSTIFHGEQALHRKQTFGFTSSRLLAEGYYWRNDGPTRLKSIGNDKTGNIKWVDFNGTSFEAFGIDAIYIFNFKRFCFGAAYNLSHHQIKSQGSWMAGISWSMYDCRFDFSKLIEETYHKLQLPQSYYKFKYKTFAITGGYSYNWVLNKHLLYNITTLPSLGLTASNESSSTGHKALPGLSIKGRMSLNYLNEQFFISLTGIAYGSFFLTEELRFTPNILNFQLSTGIRF